MHDCYRWGIVPICTIFKLHVWLSWSVNILVLVGNGKNVYLRRRREFALVTEWIYESTRVSGKCRIRRCNHTDKTTNRVTIRTNLESVTNNGHPQIPFHLKFGFWAILSFWLSKQERLPWFRETQKTGQRRWQQPVAQKKTPRLIN